jgi:large subunit ribosomal protein L18
MSRILDRKVRRERIKGRYRDTVKGTASRPRLAVYRSLRHLYAQIVDDQSGATMAFASTLEKEAVGGIKSTGGREAGVALGKRIAERAIEKGVSSVVFDRGGFSYHGVIRAIADAAREAGLRF